MERLLKLHGKEMQSGDKDDDKKAEGKRLVRFNRRLNKKFAFF